MSVAVRTLIFVLAALVVVQSIILCGATGWRVFTRYRTPEIEQANRSTGLDSLFSGTGLNATHGRIGRVESEFAFGWLPAGTGRLLISVTTVGGAAACVCLLALIPSRRRVRTAEGAAGPE